MGLLLISVSPLWAPDNEHFKTKVIINQKFVRSMNCHYILLLVTTLTAIVDLFFPVPPCKMMPTLLYNWRNAGPRLKYTIAIRSGIPNRGNWKYKNLLIFMFLIKSKQFFACLYYASHHLYNNLQYIYNIVKLRTVDLKQVL